MLNCEKQKQRAVSPWRCSPWSLADFPPRDGPDAVVTACGHGRGRMPEGDAYELNPKDAAVAMGIGLTKDNAAVAADAKKVKGPGKRKRSQQRINLPGCKKNTGASAFRSCLR